MTTPEQLAKWREEFEATYGVNKVAIKQISGIYADWNVECEWQGYLLAKQETEQAVKDARRQTLEDAASILTMWTNSHSKNEIIEELLK